jgi:hypothetical protein
MNNVFQCDACVRERAKYFQDLLICYALKRNINCNTLNQNAWNPTQDNWSSGEHYTACRRTQSSE